MNLYAQYWQQRHVTHSYSLQDKLAQSSPAMDDVETEVLVQLEENDVHSTPSEFSTLEIQVSVAKWV